MYFCMYLSFYSAKDKKQNIIGNDHDPQSWQNDKRER